MCPLHLGGWERLSLSATFSAPVAPQAEPSCASPRKHLNHCSPASPPFLPLRAAVQTEELARTVQRFGGTP